MHFLDQCHKILFLLLEYIYYTLSDEYDMIEWGNVSTDDLIGDDIGDLGWIFENLRGSLDAIECLANAQFADVSELSAGIMYSMRRENKLNRVNVNILKNIGSHYPARFKSRTAQILFDRIINLSIKILSSNPEFLKKKERKEIFNLFQNYNKRLKRRTGKDGINFYLKIINNC